MNLSVNELLKNPSTNATYRVLWIDEGNVIAYVIDIKDPKAIPLLWTVKNIEEDLIQDNLYKIKEDPYLVLSMIGSSLKSLEVRDQAWEMIRDIVEKEPFAYQKKHRTLLVNKAIKKYSTTYPTIYKNLRRYWQRGKTLNALLPDYYKSGGRGKERVAGQKKRGRPRIYGREGINVDGKTKRVFRVALEKYYLTTKKNSLKKAYEMMIKEFYANDFYIDENGILKMEIENPDQIPTLDQFRYWYNKEYTVKESLIARQGRKKYEKDHREILSSSTLETFGPGSRFQIDATIADVYLISRYNRVWIIGRPVVYVVIDVFSRLIAGIYVGLEGPSWLGAMMALANTASNKVAYCKQYGIDIPKAAWPCEHLPKRLLADRGELEGYNVERLITAFRTKVENAAPYRADWKGIVEKYFDIIQARVKPFIPGVVEPDFRQRGTRDYRLDAKLTLEQFTQIMIKQVILHNTNQYLTEYIRTEEMISDDVKPIPIDLWNWGISQNSGNLYYYSEETVKFNLLPRGIGTVTHQGIRFKGMLYGCQQALEEGWFSRARNKGSWRITIIYDPRNVSKIYLLNENYGTFSECYLLDHQERYMNKTLEEVHHLLSYEKMMKKESEYGQLQGEVGFIKDIEKIIKNATKEINTVQATGLSKSERLKEIRQHRKFEKDMLRGEEAFNKEEIVENGAEVITLKDEVEDSFNKLSIQELMKRNRKE